MPNEVVRKPWHSMPIEEVVKVLGTDLSRGLSEEEVRRRLEIYGPNVIPEKKRSPLEIFLRQFKNVFVILLLVAAAISGLLFHEVIDAIAIVIVVIIIGVSGFVQEYKAEKAIEAIKSMMTPKAKVIRDGEVREVLATELVPGDVVVIEEGDKVPADLRLVESERLEIDESMLTGESVPVSKDASVVLPEDTPVADRRNMAFMGTYVTRGRGVGVVVATGVNTEVGRIALAVQMAERERGKTHFEEELDSLARRIGAMVVVLAAIMFGLGTYASIVHGKDFFAAATEAALVAIALAVAAVPEGLPAVATLTMAVGARRMASENAIVKRLAAIETLGSCDVICTDKTGTLTKNEMTVRKLYVAGYEIDVTGSGYEPKGKLIVTGAPDPSEVPGLKLLLEAAALCNNADLVRDEKGWKIVGDPTEGALVVLAVKAGIDYRELRSARPRVFEVPFDSARKRMTTVHRVGNKLHAYMKGAPEVVIERCTHYIAPDGTVKPLTEEVKRQFLKKAEEYADKALRLLAISYKEIEEGTELSEELVETGHTLLGLVGMYDPPREGVAEAVKVAQNAGIKVIMITGDHAKTAVAIAKEIGIYKEGDLVITGRELEKMSDEELTKIIDRVSVFARVSPEHKARIVKALKSRGHIVAMTGDGVNDAPALKLADIGVAMGLRGTDVAKEAADLVLADDNFVTIVKAIREGRTIRDNIKKATTFLLSANLGEVVSVFGASVALAKYIFKPIQLLWINIVTDSFPALGIGLEPPEEDVMKRPPVKRGERLISTARFVAMSLLGLFIGALVLASYIKLLATSSELLATTFAFNTLVMIELLKSLSIKSETRLIHKSILTNRWMLAGVAAMIAVHIAGLYTPLNVILHVIPLDPVMFIDSILLALPVPIAIEVWKLWRTRRLRSK